MKKTGIREPGSKNNQSDDPRKTTRRALLGTISAIGAAGATQLPTQWTRPVVDHVVLPVHAQTSLEGCQVTCTQAATQNVTIVTGGTAPVVTQAFTIARTCERQPIGDSASTSSSTSTSFTAQLLPITTSGSTSFSISLAGSDLCTVDATDLFTVADLA